jgi:protein associated with RNAse G/E
VKRDLQRGDVIEVRQYELHGAIAREKWLSAQIVEIQDSGVIGVRFMKNPERLMYLHPGDRGRIWR